MGTRTASVGVGSRNGSAKTERLPDHPDVANMSCERLVGLTAAGDERAFAELYNRYERVAFAIAYRVLRDPELAADAVQDGFLELRRAADSFGSGIGTARSLLLTAVHRSAVERARRDEQRRSGPDQQADSFAYDDERVPSSEGKRVRVALSALPRECREAIELAYYDGMTQHEIALHLRVPLKTINDRTTHGLRTLAELLRGRGNDRDRARG